MRVARADSNERSGQVSCDATAAPTAKDRCAGRAARLLVRSAGDNRLVTPDPRWRYFPRFAAPSEPVEPLIAYNQQSGFAPATVPLCGDKLAHAARETIHGW